MAVKPQMTMDAGLNFLISQLSHVEQKVFEKKYENINYNKVIPTTNEAGEYADSITYFYMDGAAMAKFVGSNSLDVPIAEIATKKVTIPVEYGAVGYEYSLRELEQAAALNKPLPVMKAGVARRGYEQLVQITAMKGDDKKGLPGFLNNVNVPLSSVANGVNGTSDWASKSANEILKDINTMFSTVFESTKMVERPDTLALPPKQWSYIMGTPRSANSDTTIAQYVVNNSPYIDSIDKIIPINELTGAGVGGTDRAMAYTNDSDKVVLHLPKLLSFKAPQEKGLGFVVPGDFTVGGVEFRYPMSALYADGI